MGFTARAGDHLRSDEIEMVRFVAMWVDAGADGDDEVLPRFGISPALLYRTVRYILRSRPPVPDVDGDLRRRLDLYCATRVRELEEFR